VNFTAMALVSHSVTLSWAASASPNIIGYNVYRGSASGGPYAPIGFVGETSYVDTSVSSGQTYFYVATAVDDSNKQSAYSNEATAVIPAP
jgi:fibronectin type 3 domain-containing protein